MVVLHEHPYRTFRRGVLAFRARLRALDYDRESVMKTRLLYEDCVYVRLVDKEVLIDRPGFAKTKLKINGRFVELGFVLVSLLKAEKP